MNRAPRARVLRRPSVREDDGNAMVMVLAAMLLTSMMVTVIVATSVFTIRNTQATRASVQAVAAAEAGAQTVARGLMMSPADRTAAGFTCAGTYESPGYGTPGATEPQYRVVVEHKKAGQTVWSGGCPTDTADALRIRSTGLASDQGVGGVTRGDDATAEILFERGASEPRFNKAIFGDLSLTAATNMKIVDPTGGTGADLFTNGSFTCSTAMRVQGGIYVRGDALWSSSPCTADGDVVVEGSMTCPAGTSIGGDLFVVKDLKMTGSPSSPCRVNGDVWAGGAISNSTGNGAVVGGSLRGRLGLSLTGSFPVGAPPVRLGGTVTGSHAAAFKAQNTTIEHDASVGTPPMLPSTPDNEFPKLTRTDPLWSGYSTRGWVTSVDAIKGASWMPACNVNSGSWKGPLVVTSDTIFDVAAECGSSAQMGAGMTIELHADAVIFVGDLTFGAGMNVVSGDGGEHSLYIVSPWPAGLASCPATSAGSMTFSWGAWTQDSRTKVLLYAPKAISVTSSDTKIRGQMYTCNFTASTNMEITYAPVGDAPAPADLTGLKLQYLRDVTD